MSQESFPRTKPAKLTTVRELTPDTDDRVRIMGIVIESESGMALIQDIYDDVDQAERIKAIVEGKLEEQGRYLLIGDVREKVTDDGNELRLIASITRKIDDLDIKEYKEALELGEKVTRELSQ
ncbi:MAG: hypothetical protein GF309_08210 [Candidatus Lokiarchaeota archaeon]|nr:hypothetical protein [Candidatus Lokiarchaeota archaeon]